MSTESYRMYHIEFYCKHCGKFSKLTAPIMRLPPMRCRCGHELKVLVAEQVED